jgi:hypothetical protein
MLSLNHTRTALIVQCTVSGMEHDVGSRTDFVLASLGHYSPEEYRDNILQRNGTAPRIGQQLCLLTAAPKLVVGGIGRVRMAEQLG